MKTPPARSTRRRLAAVMLVVALGTVLTGCKGEQMPSDDELYANAREVNLAFKSAVGAVQAQIVDDEWRVGEYGDAPVDCDGGYGFEMSRLVPEDWRLTTDAETAARDLGEWLGTNGWTDVQVKTYSGDIGDVVVQARNDDAHVARLDVDIKAGTVADSVIVRAASTCQDGDPDQLMDILYPGGTSDPVETEPLPETERPDATPIFGFTEDGEPR